MMPRLSIEKGSSLDTKANPKAPWHIPVGRAVLCAGVSIMFTAWVIQYSFRHYRLMIPPMFDDVGYFNDAFERLQQFDQEGIQGLVRSLRQNPPHSPYSTLLAFLAYGVFGIQNWAPYAANSVL